MATTIMNQNPPVKKNKKMITTLRLNVKENLNKKLVKNKKK